MGRRPCLSANTVTLFAALLILILLAPVQSISPSYTTGRYSYPYRYTSYLHDYQQQPPDAAAYPIADQQYTYPSSVETGFNSGGTSRRRPLAQQNTIVDPVYLQQTEVQVQQPIGQNGKLSQTTSKTISDADYRYGNDPDYPRQRNAQVQVDDATPQGKTETNTKQRNKSKLTLEDAKTIEDKQDDDSDDDSDDDEEEEDDNNSNKKKPENAKPEVKKSRRTIKSDPGGGSDDYVQMSSPKTDDKVSKNMQIEVEENKLKAQTRRLVKWLRNRLRKRLNEVAELEHEMSTEEEMLVGLNRSIVGTYAERQREIKLKIARQKALKQFQSSTISKSPSSPNPASPASTDVELRAVESEKVGLAEQLARVTRTYETLAQVDKDLRQRLHTAGLSHWLRARGRDYMPESAVGVLSKSVEFLLPVATGLEKVYDLDAKAANFFPQKVKVHQSTVGKVITDTLMLLPLLPLFIVLCRARHSILKSTNFSTIHIALYSSAFLFFESLALVLMFMFQIFAFSPPFITLVSSIALCFLLACQVLLTLYAVARRFDTVELEVTQCGLLLALVAHFWKHVFIPSVTSNKYQDSANISTTSIMAVYKLAADSPPPAAATAHVMYAIVYAFIAQCKRNLLGWTCPLDDKAKLVTASISTWLMETITAIKNAFSDPNAPQPRKIGDDFDSTAKRPDDDGRDHHHRDDDETTTFVSSALSDSNSTVTSCSNESNLRAYVDSNQHEHEHYRQEQQHQQGQGMPQTPAQKMSQSQPSKPVLSISSRLQNISIHPQSVAQSEAARAATMASAAARYARWNGPNAWPIRQSAGSPSPLPWNEADVPGRLALARSSRFQRQAQTQRRAEEVEEANEQRRLGN